MVRTSLILCSSCQQPGRSCESGSVSRRAARVHPEGVSRRGRRSQCRRLVVTSHMDATRTSTPCFIGSLHAKPSGHDTLGRIQLLAPRGGWLTQAIGARPSTKASDTATDPALGLFHAPSGTVFRRRVSETSDLCKDGSPPERTARCVALAVRWPCRGLFAGSRVAVYARAGRVFTSASNSTRSWDQESPSV